MQLVPAEDAECSARTWPVPALGLRIDPGEKVGEETIVIRVWQES